MTDPTAIAEPTTPIEPLKKLNALVTRTVVPLTKLGTVVVTVARRFVPNCSLAIVTNTDQNPFGIPTMKRIK